MSLSKLVGPLELARMVHGCIWCSRENHPVNIFTPHKKGKVGYQRKNHEEKKTVGSINLRLNEPSSFGTPFPPRGGGGGRGNFFGYIHIFVHIQLLPPGTCF